MVISQANDGMLSSMSYLAASREALQFIRRGCQSLGSMKQQVALLLPRTNGTVLAVVTTK